MPINYIEKGAIQDLMQIKLTCKEFDDIGCHACPYCHDAYEYDCTIKNITGTYPDSWKGIKI